MNSERLKHIAKKISPNDMVLDVGCDHGYLDIFLKKNKLCKMVWASDISSSALNYAKENFKKYHVKIETFVSDGFNNIPENVKFNTAVIAGMGTHTILNILNHPLSPNKLIIASNNDYYLLRKKLNEMGYKIVSEDVILEHEHYYVILLCIKGTQTLSEQELLYGISNNDDYYRFQIAEREKIMAKVPKLKKEQLEKECLELKGLIERK